MGLVLGLYLTIAMVLLVFVYIIWATVPSLIRRVAGLFGKSEKTNQFSQSNEQVESSSDVFGSEDLDADSGYDDSRPVKPFKNSLSRYYPELIAVALIGWFLSGAFDYLNGPSEEELREITVEKTIAVLSFSSDYRTPGGDFADRISEDLFILLTEVPDLQVSDKQLSFEFESNSWELLGIGEVYRKLGANFIVVGMANESDNQVNISVALHDLTNRHRNYFWNNSFSGNHSEIPKFLASIRTSIVEVLQIESDAN